MVIKYWHAESTNQNGALGGQRPVKIFSWRTPATPLDQLLGGKVVGEIPARNKPSKSLKAKFKRLVREWKEERNPYSSRPDEWAMCWPYQKIIAMGPAVVPLILEEMRNKPDHWFWALAPTDTTQSRLTKRGQFKEMIKALAKMGKQNDGIIRS